MNTKTNIDSKNKEIFIKIGAEKDESPEIIQENKSFIDKIKLKMLLASNISAKEKAIFYRLLSVMLNAGISIAKSLETVEKEINNKKLKYIIRKVKEQIKKGGTFSEGLSKYPEVFKESSMGIIEAAENSGNFSEVMNRLADEAGDSSETISKVKNAMIYPIVVLLVLTGALVVIMIFVVPEIEKVFGDKSNLPLQTQILIASSNAIITYWYYIIAVISGVVIAFISWVKTSTGKLQLEKIVLAIPKIGTIRKKIILERFSSSLSSLVHAGVPIVKSLDIISRSVGSEIYKKNISLIRENISQGEKIATNLKKYPDLYTDVLASMISVGENSAQVDEVANKMSKIYKNDIDNSINGLGKIFEPLIIVIMGIGIGFIVWSIMEPIMGIAEQVAG